VAVTTGHRDATCARALERTTVDLAGVFRLRATTLRRRWLVLIPPIERFFNYYWLCAGASDAVLAMAYHGRTSLGYRGGTAPDTVRCLEWPWQGRARVTCAGPHEKDALQAGGRWSDGATAGFYRLIVIRNGWDARQPGVFLQWVQSSGTDAPEVVQETIALPLAPRLFEIEEARLEAAPGAPACVIVRSLGKRPRFFSPTPTFERVAAELGPPGQMRRVTACP
jgi:hypothetical protein